MTPPRESPSARAAAMAARMASPAESLTVGKAFSAVEAVSSPSSRMPPMAAMRLRTVMPSRASSCRQMPPATQRGAVRRPEKCPPPRLSRLSPYFTQAV